MTKDDRIELIQAKEEDLKEIYGLCQEIVDKSPFSKWSSDYPNEMILKDDLKTKTLYKIMDQDKIISVIQIRPWDEFMKNEQADDIDGWDPSIQNPCALGRFCVSPSLQGAGLGRKILTATLKKASDFGYDGAFFHVVEGNDPALHLYDSMGFHYTGVVEEFGFRFLCYEMKLAN